MPETSVVKSLITPQDQTLRTVFNAQRSYLIDIYQREYKWQEHQVKTLLNDIEVRFGQYERRKSQPKEIQEDVFERFEPYFLNTYLTHTTAANTSIVDGQQRLTTLLLMLIKLYRILKRIEQQPTQAKTFNSKVIEQLIFETNDFGEAERFKIFNSNREDAFLRHLLSIGGRRRPIRMSQYFLGALAMFSMLVTDIRRPRHRTAKRLRHTRRPGSQSKPYSVLAASPLFLTSPADCQRRKASIVALWPSSLNFYLLK